MAPNQKGKHIPWQDRAHYQVDYLFASQALADRLDSVIDISPDEWERYSDHRPIVAMFQ